MKLKEVLNLIKDEYNCEANTRYVVCRDDPFSTVLFTNDSFLNDVEPSIWYEVNDRILSYFNESEVIRITSESYGAQEYHHWTQIIIKDDLDQLRANFIGKSVDYLFDFLQTMGDKSHFSSGYDVHVHNNCMMHRLEYVYCDRSFDWAHAEGEEKNRENFMKTHRILHIDEADFNALLIVTVQ